MLDRWFSCLNISRQRQPKLQARDAGIWWGTLGKLQLMLRKAAKALYQVKVVLKVRDTITTSCFFIEWQVHGGGDAQLQDGCDRKRGGAKSVKTTLDTYQLKCEDNSIYSRSGEEWVHHNARRLRQGPRHHLHKDPQVGWEMCYISELLFYKVHLWKIKSQW